MVKNHSTDDGNASIKLTLVQKKSMFRNLVADFGLCSQRIISIIYN